MRCWVLVVPPGQAGSAKIVPMALIQAGGIELYYREEGKGSPLLLIHGTGGHADAFDKVIAPLAESHRVIAYDRRAFTRSVGAPHPKEGYFSHHAGDAVALLRALHATPAAELGWSGGALLWLPHGIEHPAAVSWLTLYEPPLHAGKHMSLRLLPRFLAILALGSLGRKRAAAERFFRLALEEKGGADVFARLDEKTRESL